MIFKSNLSHSSDGESLFSSMRRNVRSEFEEDARLVLAGALEFVDVVYSSTR